VEIWRRRLAESLEGPRILAVRALSGAPLVGVDPAALHASSVGRRCERVERHGKQLLLTFTGSPQECRVQLGMTGRFDFVSVESPAVPFERVRWLLDSGTAVVYADARRIGRVSLHPAGTGFPGLGPDALALRTAGGWAARFEDCTRAVKTALLDQARLAGVGNIYACEGLHTARVHPERCANTLSLDAWAHLATAIQSAMQRTLEREGETELRYLSSRETRENPFRIYGRHGLPCPDCGQAIERKRQAGRSTWLCVRCQLP
jgi:formamidopyrimidine-DNA glycosylase